MRFGDERESSNFEDVTGRSGAGFGGGFGGGNALGCLLPLIASRFGIGGVIVLVIGYFILSSLGGLGGLGGGGSLVPSSQQSAPAGQSRLDPNTRHFMLQVLASTEDVWSKLLGGRYAPTTLVAYSEAYQSGCGAAQSAMGPFYCPTDKKIYLDTEFFDELSRRFQAPGDFAQAYVIAHELGHHVQHILGTDATMRQMGQRDPSRQNELSVKLELQADCCAGVWGHSTQQRAILQQGDVEEGLNAAAAVGDDRIQSRTTGRVNTDTFTHGSSAQRTSWFKKGFDTGDPRACDTFGRGN